MPDRDFPPLRANDYRDTWCGQVLADRIGGSVRVAGWVHRRRDHGGLIFVDLRDRTGLVQLVFNPDAAGDAHELGHRLRSEDVISAVGEVVRRDPEMVNPEIPTGEFEIRVAGADERAAAETPPFEIESFSGEVGEEMRLRYRYLDMRRGPMRESLETRARTTAAIREYLDSEGFLEIETPMLSRSTPEGARDFLVPSRREPGSFYALPQSPQLFKQLLMVGGLERYYQIARCFRDEEQRADRQPDFTQLDLEMSFVGTEDVLDVNERLLAHVFERHGPSRHALRARAGRPHRRPARHGVQGLSRRDRRRRRRQGDQRRGARAAALRARRPDRPRAGARGQGPGVGLPRGGRLALARRQVPQRC